ncbi:YegS/Rv2252/BmrU family lipid kinase [Pseudenhygromyxa sp. WMMC2535]|uniref:YegS/Rv2252/BmrU family lipid kinase n=1 Tax=Pseudenhygromyxa sp. WMMC2535 TaxID=2712867 RepID=UPI001553CADE|nr:YegS/Rv2252/BmrU family lipid kinase [Pseudenhygromyxa sp. WMMC2535]
MSKPSAHAWLIAHGAKIDRPTLLEALVASGQAPEEVDIRLTRVDLSAREIAEAAARAGVERVVAMGGDGTINEVVDGLARVPGARTSLGIAPLGTANDLASIAELPTALPEALRLALGAEPRPVDVGKIGERAFLNVVTGGVMSEATASLDPGIKAVLGDSAYALAGLLQLPSIEPIEIRATTPSWSWSGPVLALAVGNARSAGGGFELCPGALMDDGLLDLTILPADLESGELVNILLARSVVGCERVIRVRSDRLRLEAARPIHLNADGEPLEVSDVEFEVQARSLGACLPPRCGLLGFVW